MKTKNAGFTLFELLVSISIIAILVAVATASFSSAQRKARDAKRIQDIEAVRKAAEQYYMLSNANYPTVSGVGVSWAVGSQTVLESWPSDPKGVGYTAYVPTLTASTYCVCAALESGNGNSTTSGCNFVAAGTKNWFCVRNQQ
jgi:type IV pilus assembly protein PilE